MSVKIIETRKKALKLEKEGIQFWVQKRWYRAAEGTLTSSGEKAFQAAKQDAEEMEGFKVWVKNNDAVSDFYGRVYKNNKYCHIIFKCSERAKRRAELDTSYLPMLYVYFSNKNMDYSQFMKAQQKATKFLDQTMIQSQLIYNYA